MIKREESLNKREVALSEREAALVTREGTVTDRFLQLAHTQQTLLGIITSQDGIRLKEEAARHERWSELIRREEEIETATEDARKVFTTYRARVSTSLQEGTAAVTKALSTQTTRLNQITEVTEQNRLAALNLQKTLHEKVGDVESYKAEIGGLQEALNAIHDSLQVAKSEHAKLIQAISSKRAYHRSSSDTSPEKDAASKRARSDASSPESVRHVSPVIPRHATGSIRSKLPVLVHPGFGQQQSAAGQSTGPSSHAATHLDESLTSLQEDAAEDVTEDVADVQSPSMPPELRHIWSQIDLDTNVDAESVRHLIGLLIALSNRKRTKESEKPQYLLARCANSQADKQIEMCLTCLVRTKKPTDFGENSGNDPCRDCSVLPCVVGERSCSGG